MHRILLALAAPLVATAAVAQEPSGEGEAAPLWKMECQGDTTCALSRAGTDGDGNPLIALNVLLSGEPGGRLVVITPLGTAVQQDLEMSVATTTQSVAFSTCTAQGCLAAIDVDDDTLANLLVQPAIGFRFSGIASEEPVEVQFPLEGLAAAIDDARDQLAAVAE